MATTKSLDPGSVRPLRSDAAMAAAILLLGCFLAGSGSVLVQRWRSSSARQQAISFEDGLGIVANTAGLIVITWWVMSLVFACAAALLERGGRSRAATATGKFSPAFMRRLALAAVGLQLITAQLATAATPPAVPDPGSSARPAISAAWTPTADASLPGPPNPVVTVPAAGPVAGPQWKPVSPVVEPGPLAARPLRAQAPAAAGREITEITEVTVRAGDSLWSLAAAGLGPFASDVDIATEWPRLYQANRAVIGEDPNDLLPGQVLRLPSGM